MANFPDRMRLHTFVISLRFLTFAAFGVLGVFVFGTDPTTLTLAGSGLFFGSLFIGIAGSVTLVLLSLAGRFLGAEGAQAYLSGALRQGALLGLYVAGIALAQFLGYLTWWIALLALAFIFLIEFTVRQFSRS